MKPGQSYKNLKKAEEETPRYRVEGKYLHLKRGDKKLIWASAEHNGHKIHVISNGMSRESRNPYEAIGESPSGEMSSLTRGHFTEQAAIDEAKQQIDYKKSQETP